MSEARARSTDAEVHALLRATAGVLGVALLVTTLLGMLAAPLFVRLFAPGFDATQTALAAQMTRWLFPYLACVGMTALAAGALNAYGHFLMPALAQVVLNVVMIGSIVWLQPFFDPPVSALVVGVLVGGVAQLALQVPALRARGLPLRPTWNPGHPQVRAMLARMGPALFGVAVYNLNVMVSGALASGIGAGAVTLLDYSDRFFELPLGIFAVSVATAALPTLSADAARGDLDAVKRGFASALALVLCVSIPAAVGLGVLRVPIITLLFERGAFHHADTLALAGIFVAAAPGIAAVGASRTAVQVFYALGQVQTPVRIAAVSFVLNAALGFVLRGPLGATGLTLANTCSSAVQVLLLVVALRRAVGPLGLRATVRRIAGMTVAAAVMGASLYLVPTLELWEPGGGFLARAAVLGGAVGAGALVYGAVALLVGVSEVRAVAAIARRKLLRKR